jgi:hypothetical protein
MLELYGSTNVCDPTLLDTPTRVGETLRRWSACVLHGSRGAASRRTFVNAPTQNAENVLLGVSTFLDLKLVGRMKRYNFQLSSHPELTDHGRFLRKIQR